MGNVKNNSATRETKRRLIDAAGEVFADVGFARATIKQITDRAEASLAAVNYHFSDKQELYYEVLVEAQSAALATMKTLQALPMDVAPRTRLRTFIDAFLRNMLDPERPAWHALLLAREQHEPSETLARVKSELFSSFFEQLLQLMAQLVPHPASARQLTLCVESVMGQCIFHVTHQRWQRFCQPELPPAAQRVDELVDHITCFSLAGISACAESPVLTNDHLRLSSRH